MSQGGFFVGMKKRQEQSLLWEIRNKDSQLPSYIFGTMHVKDYRAFIFQDVITEYIDKCKIFATEFDLRERSQLNDPEISRIPGNRNLEELIGKRKFERLKRILRKSFSIDLDQLKDILPLFIINMLTEKILVSTSTIPLDTFLWQYAENTHRDLRGVETFAEQLITLAKIPIDYQVKNLISIGKNPKQFRRQINGLIYQYVNGDIHSLFKKSKKSLGKQRKLLLYDRNKLMAKRIHLLVQDQTSFVAIGAAHLSGKKGVLRLLKSRGFKLKPIMLNLD